MNNKIIQYGFVIAGLINISGVLLFSRAFTNDALNLADPLVMSNFGLLVIMLWGAAYISVAHLGKKVAWISAVFCLEKLIYTVHWVVWIFSNDLGRLYSEDLFAGLFFSIYGVNDLIFILFFGWVFLAGFKK